MIKEKHQKTADLQNHFNIADDELEATLEQFIEDEEIPDKKKRKVSFSVLVGAVFIAVALTIGVWEVFGNPEFYNTDLISVLLVFGGIMVFFVGMGIAGVKSRRKKQFRKKHKKKKTMDFGTESQSKVDEYGLKQKKKLFRSSSNSMLFGVCGGIAEYFDVDPTIVRIAFAITTLYYGSSILLYLILAIFLPKEED